MTLLSLVAALGFSALADDPSGALDQVKKLTPSGSVIPVQSAPAADASWQDDLAEAIDPTGFPYPQGDAAVQKELARIRAKAQPREAALPKPFQNVLAELRALGISDVDLYHGSHVVVGDAGAHYAEWSALQAYPRISSHYRDVQVQQYELRLHGIGALLFGKTAEGDTWFQMEAHSAAPDNALFHFGDFIKHELEGGANVGPMGTSPRTDSDPIVVGPSPAKAP